MAITRFEEAKNKRYFYVNSFRKLGRYIVISMSINILIIAIAAYVFFNQKERKYYSSNGRTNPVELTSMDHPNHSSVALLADEQS